MIAHKRLHIIVIVLCLWLPLQTIAGQWSHCAKIESALSDKSLDKISSGQSAETSTKKTVIETGHQCHQASQQISEQTIDNTSDTTIGCKHCQFVCHWHCVILLAELIPAKIEFTRDYSPFETPSHAQPVLATPQRPPQA